MRKRATRGIRMLVGVVVRCRDEKVAAFRHAAKVAKSWTGLRRVGTRGLNYLSKLSTFLGELAAKEETLFGPKRATQR